MIALSSGHGSLLRASTSPVTPVDLTLPNKGTTGSLAWSSEFLVDSATVFVTHVSETVPFGCHSADMTGVGQWAVESVANRAEIVTLFIRRVD